MTFAWPSAIGILEALIRVKGFLSPNNLIFSAGFLKPGPGYGSWYRLNSIILTVIFVLRLPAAGAQVAPARGPLYFPQSNPRYFTDGFPRAVYLAGIHCWSNFHYPKPVGGP